MVEEILKTILTIIDKECQTNDYPKMVQLLLKLNNNNRYEKKLNSISLIDKLRLLKAFYIMIDQISAEYRYWLQNYSVRQQDIKGLWLKEMIPIEAGMIVALLKNYIIILSQQLPNHGLIDEQSLLQRYSDRLSVEADITKPIDSINPELEPVDLDKNSRSIEDKLSSQKRKCPQREKSLPKNDKLLFQLDFEESDVVNPESVGVNKIDAKAIKNTSDVISSDKAVIDSIMSVIMRSESESKKENSTASSDNIPISSKWGSINECGYDERENNYFSDKKSKVRTVRIGDVVTISYTTPELIGETDQFSIVSQAKNHNPLAGYFWIETPIGRAFINKRKSDEVRWETERGVFTGVIKKIESENRKSLKK